LSDEDYEKVKERVLAEINIDQIQKDIADLKQEVSIIINNPNGPTPTDPTPTDPTPTDPTPTRSAVKLIYITSKEWCKDCDPVTTEVERLREEGKKIPIIEWNSAFTGFTEDELSNVEIADLPAIYDLEAERLVRGKDACLRLLSAKWPRSTERSYLSE
jgi:hypothetical protein